jgi:hypothetical protein
MYHKMFDNEECLAKSPDSIDLSDDIDSSYSQDEAYLVIWLI